MKKVLITGMSGLIGGLLRSRLEEAGGYELTALNRRPVEGVRTVQADVADLDAIRPAFEGQDVVVHLAAELSEDWNRLLATSVVGAYNVYEAAQSAGVKRVVFASSGATIRGWGSVAPYEAIQAGRYRDVPESWPMITHENVARPQGLYGTTKVWGEALGRHFSDTYGLSVLCVRIGAVPADNRQGDPTTAANFLSHGDVVIHPPSLHRSPPDARLRRLLRDVQEQMGLPRPRARPRGPRLGAPGLRRGALEVD